MLSVIRFHRLAFTDILSVIDFSRFLNSLTLYSKRFGALVLFISTVQIKLQRIN
jgi:hypothetical protein